MGRYTLRLSRECDIHLQHWQKVGNKALLRKIEKIFSELIEHPTTGTGKPELLKGDHSGYWSRRLNKKGVSFAPPTLFQLPPSGHHSSNNQ